MTYQYCFKYGCFCKDIDDREKNGLKITCDKKCEDCAYDEVFNVNEKK